MNVSNRLIISVLALAFLAVPVFGADEGMGTVLSPPPEAVSSPAVQGITPAVAYNQYFYMFNHGVDCTTETRNSGVFGAENYNWGHVTWMNKAPPTAPYNTSAWVDCPMATIASYNGRHPYIRYGMVQYRTQTNLGAIIKEIDFYNGYKKVRQLPMTAYSIPNDAWMELSWDLGAYYDFSRGMNLAILIENFDTNSIQGNSISGYGAKGEFNA